MELEEAKLSKLMSLTKTTLRAKRGIPFKEFYSMSGKMQNASQGVPGTEGCIRSGKNAQSCSLVAKKVVPRYTLLAAQK